jgi:dihydrofolate synthase/folylpolyglutamate synthase
MTHPYKIHNKSNDPDLETRLNEILTLLYSFYDQEIDMSLARVERFLHQLGDPHLNQPPVVHLAGTNGKGSTIATLRSLLESSGKTVHVMTSPHLVHPTERVRIAGQLISTLDLIDVLEECLRVNRAEPITFFEMLTAASFLAMSRTPADYVLLETGMGGRLDATNVIPEPICNIITTVSKDHEKFLGDTIRAIASEKAGILKAGVPCVIGAQTYTKSYDVFHEISQSLTPEPILYQYGAQWSIEPYQTHLKFTWGGESFPVSHSNLIGEHQIYNTGAAIAAFKLILRDKFDAKILSPEHPKNPLLAVEWAGRLQKVTFDALLTHLSHRTQEIWLDGGHNDSAGEMLARQAKAWRQEDERPLHLIIAMVNRKNPAEFLTPLVPYVDSITTTHIPDEMSSYSSFALFEKIQPLGFKEIHQAETVPEALSKISDPDARILITGSLYFVGHILSQT